jgi:hypothetical protein
VRQAPYNLFSAFHISTYQRAIGVNAAETSFSHSVLHAWCHTSILTLQDGKAKSPLPALLPLFALLRVA